MARTMAYGPYHGNETLTIRMMWCFGEFGPLPLLHRTASCWVGKRAS